MKIYPEITGSLCANSHPGSYTGQDAFNDMLPVIEIKTDEVLDESGNIRFYRRNKSKLPERTGLQICTGYCSDEMEMLRKRTVTSDEHDGSDKYAGLHARPAIHYGGVLKTWKITMKENMFCVA